MIECRPLGICSWKFALYGEGHQAQVELVPFSEQGGLFVDGEGFGVLKDGAFSGRWRMESARGILFTAEKPSAFQRSFRITGADGPTSLSAESPIGRTMILWGGATGCRIAPAHLFTRRATIDGRWVDFRRVAFAFWLSVLLWRRAANNGGGGS